MRKTTLLDYVRSHGDLHRDSPAVVVNGCTFSYGELLGAVAAAESRIVTRAYMGDVVVVESIRPVQFIAEVVAATSLGLQVLTASYSLSSRTHEKAITDTGAKRIHSVVEHNAADFYYRDDGAVLHMTSGSMGSSKIVVRPMCNIMSEAHAVSDTLGLTRRSKVLITGPLYHSFGFGIMTATLCAGGTIYADSARSDIHDRLYGFANMLSHDLIDVAVGVPYVFRELSTRINSWNMLRKKPLYCYAGGEPLTNSLAEAWELASGGSTLRQEYGLSEGGIVSFGAVDDPPESIGTPIAGVSLSMDPDGELIVRRDCAPDHYFFGESPETFVDGSIRTGDIAYTVDGLYYLSGRKKSVIIVAGKKVVPEEIEWVIQQRCNVDEVVVVGIPSVTLGEIPAAFVVPKLGTYLSESEVRAAVKTELDSYKIPRYIHIRYGNAVPRTSSGKVDRESIRIQLLAGRSEWTDRKASSEGAI